MIDSPATSPIPPLGRGGLGAGLARTVGAHWKWYVAEGVILIVLGLLAVLAPFVAGVATTLFIGWLFLFAGVAGLIFTYKERAAPGFWWALLSSAVAVLAGLSLLSNPLVGLFSLTVVLIAYFLIDGVVTIMLGLDYRRQGSDRWGWVVFSGVVDLVLAALLLSGLPGTALWAVGVIVGIDLAFGSAALIGLALAARNSVAA
jgi:uncharacterized membrane protein HdeD (DUF308 family)